MITLDIRSRTKSNSTQKPPTPQPWPEHCWPFSLIFAGNDPSFAEISRDAIPRVPKSQQCHNCFLLLRSEIPSGICAKLRTVAASNNRDHARNLSSRTLVITFSCSHANIGRTFTSQSFLLLLARATYIMVLFFTHIPFVVNQTINATPPERLQHFNTVYLLRFEHGSRQTCFLPRASSNLVAPLGIGGSTTLLHTVIVASNLPFWCYQLHEQANELMTKSITVYVNDH